MPEPTSNSGPTGAAVDADIASAQRLIDGVMSRLVDEEQAARASYVVVEGRFAKNEQMIQQLQRENEAALNNKVQLQETWEAAREKRRQVKCRLQSMYAQARENTPMSDENFNPPRQQEEQQQQTLVGRGASSTAGDGVVAGSERSQEQDEAAEDIRPGSPSGDEAMEQPEARRSNRRRRPPPRLSEWLQDWDSSSDRDDSPTDLPPPRKRKRDASDQVDDGQHGPKSSRTEQTEGARSSQTQQTRTIDFKDLFQKGHAEYKHRILEHPKDSGKWYILKCDKHKQHFGLRPMLVQAFRHLYSKVLHGGLPQSTTIAVKELGIRVLNCNSADAAENNAAFATALENGYQVLGQKLPRGTQQTQPTSSPFDVITNPEVGRLYIGARPWRVNLGPILPATSRWSAAIILPLGNLQTVGLQGSIYTTRLTTFRTPVCYDRDHRTKNIRGWANGYEDGGPQVTNRKVPVLFFDDNDDQRMPLEGGLIDPPQSLLAWLSVSSIRPFSECDPDGKPPLGYDAALEFSQRLEAMNAEVVRGALALDATLTAEQETSPPRRGTSDAAHTANGAEHKGHGPRPKSAVERRHPLDPANRGASNRSGETTEATEDSSDGSGSASDTGNRVGSQNNYYHTGTKNPSPQGDQGQIGRPELQHVPGPALQGIADEAEAIRKSPTGEDGQRRKEVEVSFDFAPNFHTDVRLVPSSTSSSSPEGDVNNTGESDNTGLPIAESGTQTQIQENPGLAEKLSNILSQLENAHPSLSNSGSKPLPLEVREALELAHPWRRPFGDEASKRANAPRDPPACYSALPVNGTSAAGVTPQATAQPKPKPWEASSAGPSRQGTNYQSMNRHYNTAATAAQTASFLMAQTQAQPQTTLLPYVRNHLWQASVMDVEDQG